MPEAIRREFVGITDQALDALRQRIGQRIEHPPDVVAGARLRVFLASVGHVGRRIAARVEGDAAIAPREEPQLGLVAAVVAGKFVHEDDRVAGAGLLVIKADAVIGGDVGHRDTCALGGRIS